MAGSQHLWKTVQRPPSSLVTVLSCFYSSEVPSSWNSCCTLLQTTLGDKRVWDWYNLSFYQISSTRQTVLSYFYSRWTQRTTVDWRSYSVFTLSRLCVLFCFIFVSCYSSGFGPTTMSASSTCWWTTYRAVSFSATYAAAGASAMPPASSIPLRLYAP